jgi:predicted secreted protein
MNRLLFLLFFVAGLSFAESDSTYNQINFDVSASRVIKNDLLKVTMYLQEESVDAKKVAQRINQKMQKAFKVIDRYPMVHNKTGDYNIHAKYKKSKVVGWSAKQVLYLESKNIEALTTLIQKLQPLLLVSNMQFDISKALRKQLKAQLLLVLLDKFRKKSKLISEKLGAKSYKIVRLNINKQSDSRPVYYSSMRSQPAFLSSASDMPAPKLSGGENEIKVSLNALLELSFRD